MTETETAETEAPTAPITPDDLRARWERVLDCARRELGDVGAHMVLHVYLHHAEPALLDVLTRAGADGDEDIVAGDETYRCVRLGRYDADKLLAFGVHEHRGAVGEVG